ncbi:MAG: hypothetical protein ACD_54C00560G0001 [uncultured bacterium]|nr:MAG: hypothetical protein ACD_54C00560G0001 [uncultured bacterium]
MPNIAENTPPVSSIPAQPKGEMTNNCRKLIALIESNVGAGVSASRIGMNASDTSTDGMMNSPKPLGSPIASRP